MKILYVITRLVKGGAQKIVTDTLCELDKRGHDCTLISGAEDISISNAEKFKKETGINLIITKWIVRNPSLIRDIGGLFFLIKHLVLNKYDVIHTHTSKAGILGRIAARLTMGKIIIHTQHGSIYNEQSNIPDVTGHKVKIKVFLFLEKIVGLFTNKLITLTDEEKNELASFGVIKNDKMITIHNGINVNHYLEKINDIQVEEFRRRYSILPEDFVLLSAGRLSVEKGHSVLIKAVNKLYAEGETRIKVIIAGEGPEGEELSALIDSLSINNIIMPGHVDDIRELYAIADLYIQPSFYEGFGLSVLEAFACKVPVIASNTGGLKTLIKSGENGILFEPGDEQGLAEQIKCFISHKAQFNAYAENAFKVLLESYDFNTMINSIESLYYSIV